MAKHFHLRIAYIEELSVGKSTNANGYFIINSIPSNRTYTLIVTYVGYASKKIRFEVSPQKTLQLSVKMTPINLELQTMRKSVKGLIPEKNAIDIGLNKLTLANLEYLPKGIETDVFRTLQYIPGVSTTSDIHQDITCGAVARIRTLCF
jgi:hypothetical protein